MIISQSELDFWNDTKIVDYFAAKEPDPRVVERIDMLGNNAGSLSLDLGCGGGRHSQLLAESGFSNLAVDINPAMLAMTANRTRHLPNTTTSFGTINDIPVREGVFDVVVSTGVLHQARSAMAMNQAVAEVARVTKKGAIFIGNLFVRDIWDETYTIPDPTCPEFVETRERVGMTLLDADQASDMFTTNGFLFEIDPVVDFKQENTGPRGVFRFSAELVG